MPKLENLRTVTVSITDKCNLACKWCFENSGATRETYLKKEYIKKIIDELEAFKNIRSITFTGGEPLLHNDIHELIDYSQKKYLDHLHITTNGLLITDEFINFCRGKKISFGISIDGLRATHEGVRGKGTYDKTIEKIKLLRHNNFQVGTTTTVSRNNIGEIDGLIGELYKTNANWIMFQRMRNIGKGKAHRDMILTPEENKKLSYIILKKRDEYKNAFVGYKDPFVNVIDEEFQKRFNTVNEKNKIFGGCRVGVSYLFVASDGTCYPCPFLRIPLGNVANDKLPNVWGSEKLSQFLNRDNYAKCNNCRYWNICRGCRAEAAINQGDCFGVDQGCWMQ